MKLERALAYIELGWAVFPLIPNTKKPLTKNGFKDATKSVYLVKKWWTDNPDANIAIATGKASELAVVDVDVKNGAKGLESLASLNGYIETLTAITPSGGRHLYYLIPEDGMRCRNGFLPGIDLKADGGYVVAPGSVIDGKDYEWLDPESHIINIPDCIIEIMKNGNGNKTAQIQNADSIITEGQRNSTLTSMAGAMRRKGMKSDEISVALQAVNASRCSPPLPDAEIETISSSIARYPPEQEAEDDIRPPGFTDDALALEFTQLHALDWRYVASWGYWLHWEGNCWLKETTLKAYDLARKVCRSASARCLKPKIAAKIASASTVAAVERLARADRKHAATIDQWDCDACALNSPGGEVNLITGEMRPHNRLNYLTKITIATPAHHGTIAPLWQKFLDDVTNHDKELQLYLARMAGYALTGITTEHALFFLYGTGANGKSVFLNTLAAIMGDYAVSAPIDTFLETKTDKHPTDLAGLRGARLVTSIEVEKGKKWAEAKIKSLTGGDRIAARFMRQDFFEYKPQFKLIIAGNNKPSIRDVDEAMKRRLHLVPFTVTIPVEKRDKTLPEKLLHEQDAILRWALDGCLEWQKIGLNPPACVVSATEEYLESEDALGRWIEDECILNPNATGTTDELFDSWKAWAEKNGEFIGTKRRFSDDLDKRGFKRKRLGHTCSRAFQGIGMKGKVLQENML